jgi:hypothetical protein
MKTSQLPLWVLYVQALAPTFVAIVAALIAGYIALRQWWTAHDRLSFDLFEKRFAVYQATQTLISTLHGGLTPEDMGHFYEGIRGAEFFFDGDTRNFLMNIGDMALRARSKRFQLEQQPNHPNLDQLIKEEESILNFLRQQDQNLERLFSRYLDLSKVGLRR